MSHSIKDALREIENLARALPQPYKGKLEQARYKIIVAIEEKFSQLEDGKIPAGKICPFKNKCPSICHKKDQAETSFSCGSARAFDMVESGKKAEQFIK